MKTKKSISAIIVFILITICMACQTKKREIGESLKGWEHLSTVQVLLNKSIIIVDKRARIIKGKNNVLIVKHETRPIYKADADTLVDVQGSRNLFIEFNSEDTLITPNNLGRSKIYTEILTLSPEYGVNSLKGNEKIAIKRVGPHWIISSDFDDFKFETQFSFADSSILVSKYQELIYSKEN